MVIHIIRILTYLLIPIIFNGFLKLCKQSKQTEKGKVHLPRLFVLIGTIGSALFLIPALITMYIGESIWIPVIFLLLTALGASLIIGYVNCRISYDEDGFVSKNFLGIKRKFTYDQVTAIKEDIHESFVYMGKRRVMVDRLMIGGNEFIYFVRKKYRALHNGQNLPKIHKSKYDIFNGHVNGVGGIIFAYTLVAVLLVGLLAFSVCYAYFSPSTTDNTIQHTVSFISCNQKDDEIILTSADNQIYKIRFIIEPFDAKSIQALCDGKKVVTTYSDEVTPDDEKDYYSIKAILYNDEYLLTFEQTDEWHTQEYKWLVVFVAAMVLVWGIYVAFSIVVGRNPRKFSKRVIRIFFQDGYINY